MSSVPLDLAQQEPSTTAGPDQAASDLLVPTKREHNDEVQFISSQPIKKMRLTGDEPVNRDQSTGPQASGPQASGPGDEGHAHFATAWGDRGTSLPAMETFSFPTAHTAACSQSTTSAAVSPKQQPKTASPGVIRSMHSHVGQASSSRGMTIDQISCLDVRETLDSLNATLVTNLSNLNNSSNLNTASNANVISVNTMVPITSNSSMASFRALEPFPTRDSTPNSSYSPSVYIPRDNQAAIPFTMHTLGNQVALPRASPSLHTTLMPMTPNRGLALNADKAAPFGVVISVMDILKEANVQNVPAFTEVKQ